MSSSGHGVAASSLRDPALCIGFEHPELRYEIVYGVSDNKRSCYDNANAYRLGYKPEDDSEPQTVQVLFAETGQVKNPARFVPRNTTPRRSGVDPATAVLAPTASRRRPAV
jgi:hypothetical protein